MFTNVNSEDRLVQQTFADYLRDTHRWDSVYAWTNETFGLDRTLGRTSRAEGKRGHPALHGWKQGIPTHGGAIADPQVFRSEI